MNQKQRAATERAAPVSAVNAGSAHHGVDPAAAHDEFTVVRRRKYGPPQVHSRKLSKAEMQELLAHAKSNGRLLNLGRGMAELYLWEKGIDPRPRPPRWSESLPVYDPQTGETETRTVFFPDKDAA